MKEILASPIIIGFILVAVFIYLLLLFTYVGSDKKRSITFEKICAGFFLFTITGATGITLEPFNKFNPIVLYQPSTTLPTLASQLGFYAICLLILYSRLRYTFKELIYAISQIITKEPALSILLLITTLSTFWSETPLLTFKSSLSYLMVAGVAVYVAKQYSWTELYTILRFVTFLAMLLSFYKNNVGPDNNWCGILGHKNQFSFFMALTAALWFLYAIYNRKQRRISFIIFILAEVALQKGGSGASKVLVVVLLALWAYLGFVKKLKPQWAFVSVVLFMVVSIGLTIVITDNIQFIVVDTLHKDLTLTGRLDFWPQILDKINERPLLGYGVNGFWQPWRGPDNPAGDIISARTLFKPPHSHNGFLDMGLELGYLGVGLYLITFFNNIARGVIYLGQNKLPEAGMPLLLLTYILMTNFTETGLFGVTSNWFWFVVITVRLIQDTTRKNRSPEVQVLEQSPL